MRLARYWVREEQSLSDRLGNPLRVAYWGWSETSEEEARQRAREGVQRLAERVLAGDDAAVRREPTPRPSGYGYGGDRPLREQVLQEINDQQGRLLAAVTRNSAGALVLNTRDLMFIDIDFPPEPPLAALFGAIKRLFGRPVVTPADEVRRRVEDQLEQMDQYTTRLYATCFGLRCAIVDRPIEPGSVESEMLLHQLQADPLYVQLCKKQECYRARLTPKFWRCGADRPPARFPWSSPEQEQAFQSWEWQYREAGRGFATCRLLGTFGNGTMFEEFDRLIELHDGMTRAKEKDLPLA